MTRCPDCGQDVTPEARFCSGCGSAVAGAREPAEERKLATVLFADLVGSTALADAEDPERTRRLLARFYDAVTEEVGRRGGTVDKFMGDGVLVVFGAPVALEDHAERALHAALAMRARVTEVFEGALRLRIGINTGDLIVGHPRASTSFVTGDVVNVAARLEQAADPGSILVGERTAAAVGGAFRFERRTRIAAKGKASGVECRVLLDAVSEVRPRGIGSRRAFVGRVDEGASLRAAYDAVTASGAGALLAIVGDAGIGKTALTERFRLELSTRSPAPLVYVGRCRASARGTTYEALGEIVREYLSLERDLPADLARERLGRRVMLGPMLGLRPPAAVHPMAVQERVWSAWTDLLREMAADRAVVLVVEDLHWADDLLLDLLDATVGEVQAPLLVVVTGRPELLSRRRDWTGEGGRARTVSLVGLSGPDAELLLGELVEGGLPEALRSEILERADGNPFYLEELVRALADQGALEGVPGEPDHATAARMFEIPDSVHAVVAARIDLLPPAEKAALQVAAVMGRAVWSGAITELVGSAPDLHVLEERGFIVAQARASMGTDVADYRIAHAQIREVAYETLPRAARARLHARFGDWLERVAGEREDNAARLAHHYAEAVRPEHVDLAWGDDAVELGRLRERAVEWLRTASAHAVGRFEIAAGLALLEDALAIESPAPVRVELWREVAFANALRFDARPFRQAMMNAIALCDDEPTEGRLHAELAFQTMIRPGMWNTAPDGDLVAGWVARALDLTGPVDPARARALIARGYADYAKAAETIEAAGRIAELLDDPVLRSYCYDLWGLRELARGDAATALGWHRRRLGLADLIDDPDHRADIYLSAVAPAAALGRFDEARGYASACEEATIPLSAHHRLHGVAGGLQLEELVGDWRAVLGLQPRVEEAVAANVDTPCSLSPRSLLVCALAQVHVGSDDEARRLESAAERYGLRGYGTVIDAPRMQIAMTRGDRAVVESLLGRPAIRRTNWVYLSSMAAHLDALAFLGRRRELEVEASAALSRGGYLEPFAARSLGRLDHDLGLIRRAVERFEALGLAWHASHTAELIPS